MEDHDGMDEIKKSKSIWYGFITFFAVSIPLLCLNQYQTYLMKPYRHPTLLSAPYNWPSGCLIKNYNIHDNISYSCRNEKYAFYNWKNYGLRWFGRFGQSNGPLSPGPTWGNYYRVGNDLLGIQCSGLEHCYITGVERNVYIVKPLPAAAETGSDRLRVSEWMRAMSTNGRNPAGRFYESTASRRVAPGCKSADGPKSSQSPPTYREDRNSVGQSPGSTPPQAC